VRRSGGYKDAMSKRVRKAVIPVAGFGTRVLPASKAIPKELLPVVDRPLIHYIMEEALEAGIEHLCFVTGRGKSAIEDYFDHQVELEQALEKKNKKDILSATMESVLEAGRTSFTRQQKALGLGHAVWCARDIVGDEPFAVLLPDVIIKGRPKALKEMMDRYEDGANLLAVEEVPMEETNKYGVIAPKGEWSNGAVEMSGMVEKPDPAEAPSNYSITGRYILQPEIFGLLEKQGPGAGNEIQLTDSMASLLDMQKFLAVTFTGESHDCGSIEGFVKANIAFGMDHPQYGDGIKEAVAALR
jgi:UTP--glucose-1-phosphate uridylyltransferase